jgi:hypothetical protein
MGTEFFPWVKSGPGRDPDPSPPCSALGHERVELYLYFPYGPYGLYKGALLLIDMQIRIIFIVSVTFETSKRKNFVLTC